MIGKLYKILWYRSQFWLPKEKRRPYTFILRDIYHDHPILWTGIIIAIGYWLHYWLDLKIMIAVGIGIVLGHLFWGTRYQEGEQEEPPYLGG